MSPLRWTLAAIMILALTSTLCSDSQAAKPSPAPQMVAVVRASLESGSCIGFIAVDTSGRVLTSQCYAPGFALAAQLPGVPVSLHYPGGGSSELYVGLANGDIYGLNDTRTQRPWTFSYMGNVLAP
jgi:hypothetical protein